MKKVSLLLVCLLSAFVLSACGKPLKNPAPFEGEAAAVVSVYGYDSESEQTYGLMYLGHAFLSVENVSADSLTVGPLTLQPGEACTLGSWGMNAHFGIWYNIESHYINNAGMYDGRVSVSKSITVDGLAAFNALIAKRDNWSPIKNCAHLAVELYDEAGGDKLGLSGIVTPTKLKNEIRRWTHHEVNRPIQNHGQAGFLTEKGFKEYAYRD